MRGASHSPCAALQCVGSAGRQQLELCLQHAPTCNGLRGRAAQSVSGCCAALVMLCRVTEHESEMHGKIKVSTKPQNVICEETRVTCPLLQGVIWKRYWLP